MWGCGGEVRIAHTLEHTQMVVRRWGAEEDEVRCGGLEYFGGEQVEEVGGGIVTAQRFLKC